MKKALIITVAVVLCLSVVGAVFALYKVEPDNLSISITAGSATNLQISGLSNDGVKPGTPYTKTITLTNPADAAGHNGVVKIALSGDLAAALNISYVINDTTYTDKAALASTGVTLTNLTEGNITSTLTLTFNTSLDYADYAEKTATVTITYDFIEVESVQDYDCWYLVGDFNSWKTDGSGIKLGAGNSENHAISTNVALAVGQYKAVCISSGEGHTKTYTTGDNWGISTAGNYNIFVNKSNGLWIEAYTAP